MNNYEDSLVHNIIGTSFLVVVYDWDLVPIVMVQHYSIFSYAGVQDRTDAWTKSHISSEPQVHDEQLHRLAVVLETMEMPDNSWRLHVTFSQLIDISVSSLWLGWKHLKSTH